MKKNQQRKLAKIYPLKYYTQTGYLKPPAFFYIGLLFLARTWIILILSLASRETGQKILALLLPDRNYFYWGLASGAVSIILLLLSGRDHEKHPWIQAIWKKGALFLLASVSFDLCLQLYHLYLDKFQYSLAASIQLVFVSWFLLYCIKSKHLKACFTQT